MDVDDEETQDEIMRVDTVADEDDEDVKPAISTTEPDQRVGSEGSKKPRVSRWRWQWIGFDMY